MAESNGKAQPRYTVGLTGLARTQLLAISDAAAWAGSQNDVDDAYVAIIARLKRNPFEFGEPLYHLKKMKMTIYCAACSPLYLEYGLHDEQPIVVIRRFVSLIADS